MSQSCYSTTIIKYVLVDTYYIPSQCLLECHILIDCHMALLGMYPNVSRGKPTASSLDRHRILNGS